MNDSPVSLSDSAAERITEIIANEPTATMLRVSVEGGGCSGFQYKFDLVQEKLSDDLIVMKGSATVLIDSVSLVYMKGSIIDFKNDLIGASFQISNPNVAAACGCGTSFTI